MERKVLFFDCETNGLIGSSVLSFSAYVVQFNLHDDGVGFRIIEKIDRYYYPKESFNEGATNINGLRKSVLDKRRAGVDYPEYFIQDDYITELCNKVDLFVAHNIKFDESFLPIVLDKDSKLCTMTETVNTCKMPFKYNPNRRSKPGDDKYKNPKLMEMARFFNVAIDEENLHNSLYDVHIMFESFIKIAEHPNHSKKIEEFLFSENLVNSDDELLI